MAEIEQGVDGWLFLTGGSNDVLRLYTDPDYFTPDHAHAWLRLLKSRQERLAAQGVAYFHMIVPDKISAFPGLFPGPLQHFNCHPLAQLQSLAGEYGLEGCLIDCLASLSRQEGRYLTYYKTDSHWTVWGAYVAYALTCRAMGVPPSAMAGFEDRQFASWPVIFDLGSKLPEPRAEDCIFTPMNGAVTRTIANVVVALREEAERSGTDAPMHHGSHVVFRNASPRCVSAKLVIFGDSFADYRPSTMTAFFAETFAETHFVWSTGLDYGYIAETQPDFVLSEIAERFMTMLPTDDYDVRLAAAARVEAFRAAHRPTASAAPA